MMDRLLRAAIAAAIAFSSLAFTAPAYAGNVRFNCGTSPTGICYFQLVYSSGGHRNFTLYSNQSDVISGVHYGDRYCIDYNGTPRNCRGVLIPREHIND